MIKYVKGLLRGDDFNILSTSIGIQVLGYALSLTLMPFAIAFYSPADFGRFAVVFFFANLVGSHGGLRLEWAIINDHSDHAAKLLLQLGCTLVLISAALLFALILVVPSNAWERLHVGRSDMIWAAPVAVAIGVGIFQQSFGIRRQLFSDVYFSRNVVMVSRQVFQIGIGAIQGSFLALVLTEIFARALGCAVIIRRLDEGLHFLTPAQFYKLADAVLLHRYGHYTKIALPSSLIDFAMVESLAVLLLLVQGPDVAGAYWLVMRIFGLPVALIGTVVGDVFQGQMAREKDRDVVWRYMLRTALLLTGASVLFLPAGTIALRLFTEYFYEGRWALSGLLALILLPAICVQFVASPLSRSLIVLKKMQYKYIFDACNVLALGIWVAATGLLHLELIESMVLLSATQTASYLAYLALSFWVVRTRGVGENLRSLKQT